MTSTWQDTEQQKAALRQSATARRVRALYPQGSRVRYRKGTQLATVYRHVPMRDAQGGDLVVDWDSGVRGRLSPMNAERVYLCPGCAGTLVWVARSNVWHCEECADEWTEGMIS